MARKSNSDPRKEFLSVLREVRTKLAEINQKLEHLIRSCRQFHLTTDFSDSSLHEFKR